MGTAAPARVQALAETGVSRLPAQYIQPPESRPAPSPSPVAAATLSVPVVDLSSSTAADAVRAACADWGAFHVVGHGVPGELLDAVREAGVAFFRAPMEDKLRFACDPARGAAAEGYGSRMLANDDSVLDWRDYFDHHTLPESRRDPAHWPDFVPGYRDTIAKYSNSMKDLAQNLLCIISENLNLPPSYIEEAVGEVYQNITISYYSPCPQPDLALGLQSHSDMGAITLLIQDDVGGLEVLKDGMWIPVPALRDGILVILADQTEIITNGRYKSSVHRAVVNAERARFFSSMPTGGLPGHRPADARSSCAGLCQRGSSRHGRENIRELPRSPDLQGSELSPAKYRARYGMPLQLAFFFFSPILRVQDGIRDTAASSLRQHLIVVFVLRLGPACIFLLTKILFFL